LGKGGEQNLWTNEQKNRAPRIFFECFFEFKKMCHSRKTPPKKPFSVFLDFSCQIGGTTEGRSPSAQRVSVAVCLKKVA
jgi:hypothetical protein